MASAEGQVANVRVVKSNWSSRLLGTHPLKAMWLRSRCVRLERLPSSAGISPLKALLLRSSHFRLERLPSSGGISPLKSL